MVEEKLNILYICPDDSMGGSTRSLLDLVIAVNEHVHPIVLFSSYSEAWETFNNQGIETIVHPYIKLHLKAGIKNALIHPWRSFIVRLFRYDIACALYVKKYLRGRSLDFIHSNYSPIYIGVILSKVLKVKHVWHVREFLDLDFHYKVYGGITLLRKFINHADARIAITSSVKKHWDMPNENSWVILDAVRSKDDIIYVPNKERYILHASYNLSEYKGTRNAIIAFARSGMADNGYVLKLVGNCTEWYKKSLMRTINEYSIANSVKFIPCQNDIKPFFAQATAYLMTSDFEALGRVTAEAMFYGCPVIAHATGGSLDLINNGETGYLYDTIDECSEIIRKICSSAQDKVIQQAQDFVVNNLSYEVYGPKIMNVYHKLLNDKC